MFIVLIVLFRPLVATYETPSNFFGGPTHSLHHFGILIVAMFVVWAVGLQGISRVRCAVPMHVEDP